MTGEAFGEFLWLLLLREKGTQAIVAAPDRFPRRRPPETTQTREAATGKAGRIGEEASRQARVEPLT